MRSMIYPKKAGGTVKVYNKDTVDQIVDESEWDKTQLELFMKKGQKHDRGNNSRVLSAPASMKSVKSLSTVSQTNQSMRTQDWLDENTIKELQVSYVTEPFQSAIVVWRYNGNHTTSKECHGTKQLCKSFLETERNFVKELDDYLAYKEFTNLRRKELLYKKWTYQVYEPIRKKILDVIDTSDWNNIDHHKREMHKRFLEYVNRRGFVFLNNNNKEDNCLETVNLLGKVKTRPLLDPLHVEARERNEEDRSILRCITGRSFTDSDLRQMRLPPLPHDSNSRCSASGSRSLEVPFYSIETLSGNKNRRTFYGNSAKTSFDFRAWATEGHDAKIATDELQIPHKRMFTEHPPFGRPTAAIPRPPFIDPEEFADKIVNTNPFPHHMANLRAEAEALKELLQIQQDAGALEPNQIFHQDNEHQEQRENNGEPLENSRNQPFMEADQQS